MTRATTFAAWAGVVAALGLAGCERSPSAAGTSTEPGQQRGWQPPGDGSGQADAPQGPAPVPPAPTLSTGHPRLFVRGEDLARLRSWAVPGNPSWIALSGIGASAKAEQDAGKVPDAGECAYQNRFCESYAEVFAFLSLVAPSAADRADYGERAKILMVEIRRAAAAAPTDPMWGTRFSTYNRSRWAGEAFPVTVDWIYPLLSAAEKAEIRAVFLRWCEDLLHATVTTSNHPEPIGVLANEVLLKDKHALRYAANNYFVGHMRNLGLMAMSLDAADDPPDAKAKRTYPRLRDYLGNAIGAWMYMQDKVFRGDAAGGAPPEGFEYGPENLAYITQLHLALRTAGEEDAKKYGPQTPLDSLPFWDLAPEAYAHALMPAPVTRQAWLGPVYEPAWYGDGENYTPLDPIGFYGALGVYGMIANQPERVNTARYIETYMAAGGTKGFGRRASAYNGGLPYLMSIWYFLLFDPKAPAPTDYRPKLPLRHLEPGIGQIHARTSWGTEATAFNFMCGWETIDHRHGDGNSFGFYRKGEWLTKERVGYGFWFENSDQHNTLAIENGPPRHATEQRVASYAKRGSQYVFFSDDGHLAAHSFGKGFVYALGDATGLYNSPGEGVRDVTHASRSIVWMEPDFIVIYDRATTQNPDRFKRFFLQTPAQALAVRDLSTMKTTSGQQLFVRTLLPADARIGALTYQPTGHEDRPAEDEPMKAVLRVEPRTVEKDARFLHVLEGADAGAAATPSTLLKSTAGTPYAGAAAKDFAVLFPVELGPVTEVDVTVPAAATRVLVTGLEPNGAYDARRAGTRVTVKKGGAQKADAGGVLEL